MITGQTKKLTNKNADFEPPSCKISKDFAENDAAKIIKILNIW